MKIKHNQRKGVRYNCSSFKTKYGRLTVYQFVNASYKEKTLWYCEALDKFLFHDEIWGEDGDLKFNHSFSSSYGKRVCSKKALIRLANKHKEYLPKGTEFLLYGRFRLDIIATI